MKRIGFDASPEIHELWTETFFEGSRSIVMRSLLVKACNAVSSGNITVDEIVRGDFKIVSRGSKERYRE